MRHLSILTCLLGLIMAPPVTADALPAPDPGATVEDEAAPGATTGRIYRMTDAQGRVIFTDSPPAGAPAQEVRPSQPNAMPPPPRSRAQDRRAPERQPDAFTGYTALVISAPPAEETYQNPQEPISVQVEVSPDLQGGHSLRILHNGEPLAGQALTQPFRGAHALKAQVLDAQGKVLKESDTITIYVHRPSALLGPGARRNAPDKDTDKKGS